MGVAGAGKSLIGSLLAAELQRPFLDGDDLHPAANVAKMTAGRPLDDDDRAPWLDAVGAALAEGDGTVVACSALRRAYRDRIRARAPQTVFVELDADPALIRTRMTARAGHLMPPVLLASQLATLEGLAADERGGRVDASGEPSVVAGRAVDLVRTAEGEMGGGLA